MSSQQKRPLTAEMLAKRLSRLRAKFPQGVQLIELWQLIDFNKSFYNYADINEAFTEMLCAYIGSENADNTDAPGRKAIVDKVKLAIEFYKHATEALPTFDNEMRAMLN